MLATLVRTITIYIVVTIAIRFMGKRQIGDMKPNELVITLLISEIAAIPLQDSNQPVINGISAISVLVIAEITLSLICMKSNAVRRIVNGKSAVLIADGRIDEKALKRVRITVDDLLEMLREKDIFDINEVLFAILEVNGELNVFQKREYKNVTRKDMNILPETELPYLPVIIDKTKVKDFYEYLDFNNKSADDFIKNNNIDPEKTLILLATKAGDITHIKKEDKR